RSRHPLDLVLTDFGIASRLEGSRRFTSASRTLHYASPEAGGNMVLPASDYWSLGMIVVEMLAGHHPFADVAEERVKVHIATRPVPLLGVEGAWKVLCQGLLTRNPDQRWGKAEIDRWLAG